MDIQLDDLTHPAVHALLQEHLTDMHAITPAGSVHALDLERLRRPEITFWSAWEGPDLVGIGALQELASDHGEIKSMRTPASGRRRGAARRLLAHIMTVAHGRGYTRLSLETGASAAFTPARTLYASAGFAECGRFGAYADDPHSVFMTKSLSNAPSELDEDTR